LLAKIANDNARSLIERVVLECFASKLAPAKPLFFICKKLIS